MIQFPLMMVLSFALIGAAIGVVYFIIRVAVRDGIADAHRNREISARRSAQRGTD